MNCVTKVTIASAMFFVSLFANAATDTTVYCDVEGWGMYFSFEKNAVDFRDPRICGGYMGCEEATHLGKYTEGTVVLTETEFKASGKAQPYSWPYENGEGKGFDFDIQVTSPSGFIKEGRQTVSATVRLGSIGPVTQDCTLDRYNK